MFGFSDDDDRVLVFEYMSNGNLRSFLESHTEILMAQRKQWCVEAAEAVVLLHSYGIIHADIRPENMLLDENYGLRIIDLSGASIDGKCPLSLESTRFFLPRSMKDEMPCSIITDIFALGSSIYQIMTRRQPYDDLMDEEVEARFARKEFPEVDGVSHGGVIRKCWMCEFHSAQEVLDSLKAITID
jgi:serine/threonine protein kinase